MGRRTNRRFARLLIVLSATIFHPYVPTRWLRQVAAIEYRAITRVRTKLIAEVNHDTDVSIQVRRTVSG